VIRLYKPSTNLAERGQKKGGEEKKKKRRKREASRRKNKKEQENRLHQHITASVSLFSSVRRHA
jgi:hypothetical protein